MVLARESKSSRAPGAADGGDTTGSLIINADDWGKSRETTDRTLECWERGSISSVSAMVFMEDSVRAAALARERGIDAGLHLNLTTPFSGGSCPAMLRERQQRIGRRLRRHRFAPVMFYPELFRSFEYVVSTQLDEFRRLYGTAPQRLDGHHHMHLCTNVLLGGLLPPGTIARRSFSFDSGERSFANRFYRRVVDRMLARHHSVVDFFFSLMPLKAELRLQRIFSLGRQFVVEVETHPINPPEHQFLTGGELLRWAGDYPIADHFAGRSMDSK
jgi:chitin disaccharide deacetylase